MLKIFLAALAPLLLCVPLLLAFADDAPPPRDEQPAAGGEVAGDVAVDAAGEVSTLLVAAEDAPRHHVRPRNAPKPPRHDL